MICVGIVLMWIVIVTAAAAVAAATLMEVMAVATAEDGSVDAVLSLSASGYFGEAAVGRGGSVDMPSCRCQHMVVSGWRQSAVTRWRRRSVSARCRKGRRLPTVTDQRRQ